MSSKPKTTKDVVAVKDVNRIIQALLADDTLGWTPMASINGPLTIPPPTPNIPAKKPAAVQMTGYTMVARESHLISPSTYGYPTRSLISCRRTRYIRAKILTTTIQPSIIPLETQNDGLPHRIPSGDGNAPPPFIKLMNRMTANVTIRTWTLPLGTCRS